MLARESTKLRVQQYWAEIIPYATAQNVSTLTTLLAFTDYGTEYKQLAVFLSNESATDNVSLIVDVSNGGTKKVAEVSQTVLAAPETEVYSFIGEPNPFTYVRIAAQSDSPGFPTVAIKWALLGIPR